MPIIKNNYSVRPLKACRTCNTHWNHWRYFHEVEQELDRLRLNLNYKDKNGNNKKNPNPDNSKLHWRHFKFRKFLCACFIVLGLKIYLGVDEQCKIVFCSAILFSYLASRNILSSRCMFSQSLSTFHCSGVFSPFREQECKSQNLCFKIHLRVCISENSLRRGEPGGERLWMQEELGCTVQDALHRWLSISTCALPNLSGLIWDIFWNVTWQAGSKAKRWIMVGKQRTSVFALFL